MYKVDSQDRVIELSEFQQSSIGAPCPMVVASEHDVAIAYYLRDVPKDWDGTTVKVVDTVNSNEPICIVVFKRCTAHYFGPPNDEAFSGHPLADRGLSPYGSYEVVDSSWIRTLEEMNAVHPYHDKERFLSDKRHIVLTFHDSIFECITRDFTFHYYKGALKDVLSKMADFVNS